MKFNTNEKNEYFSVKKNLNKKTISDLYNIENLPSFRFDNIGVFLTSKKNIPFKLLSSVINNGDYPVSWTMKIYHNNNEWAVQLGVHPNAENNISLYGILEKFKEKFEVETTGHNNVASIVRIKNKNEVEKIAKSIIKLFRDVKLEINDFDIIEAFTLENSDNFYIPDNDGNLDSPSLSKFKESIKIISKYSLDEEEEKILKKINGRLSSEKYISEKGKDYLNNLMKKYLTEHERISVAMKSLYKGK